MKKVFFIMAMLLMGGMMKGQTPTYNVGGVNYQPIMEVKVSEGTYSGDISIPETIDINGVPYFVTEIGDYAFTRNPNVTSIKLTQRIKRIGQYGLAGCSYKEIFIPNTVLEIGIYAFSSTCENIKVSEDSSDFTDIDGVLYDKDLIRLYQYPESKIGDELIIPEGVIEVKSGGLKGGNLKSIDIPSSLRKIGNWNFVNMPNLQRIIVRAKTPPFAKGNVFGGRITSECTLFVPTESIEDYKNESNWSEFQNIRGLDEITDNITTQAPVMNTGKKFDLRGMETEGNSRIYIQDGKKIIGKP